MSNRKILIVEDEETSRKIIGLAVQGPGREIFYAKDGDEAVRLAVEKVPDLIIMDVMIPRIDGFHAAKIIKGNEALRNITIVALTARTGEYDEQKAREAGCDDYLTKPFRVGELRDRLEKYLGD